MQRGQAGLFRLVFGFDHLVGRREYAVVGLTLGLIKFAGDALIARAQGGSFSPLLYLSPSLLHRLTGFGGDSDGALLALSVWALPFVWIGISLTIRRCLDAGISGWAGLLFFVPFVNYCVFATLCLHPSVRADWNVLRARAATAGARVRFDADLLQAVLAGAAVAGASVAASVAMNGAYGAALFTGCPFGLGVVTSGMLNRRRAQSMAATQGTIQLALLVVAGALILFAVEGLICLAMAYPLATAFAAMGGVVGRSLMLASRPVSRAGLFVLLVPGLVGVDATTMPAPPLRPVTTSVEIAAPPPTVWRSVVSFSELDPPAEWLFRTGIAYPMRAEIEGRGVGAVRHCVFSTGAFVEPITVWDEPHRLAFDVVAQPPTMEEWSPYAQIEPAHLLEGLRSERGEFRLEPLDGGGTRLIGTTWYRSYLFPQLYWGPWSDGIIHAIHRRVLNHVAQSAEARRPTGRTRDGKGGRR